MGTPFRTPSLSKAEWQSAPHAARTRRILWSVHLRTNVCAVLTFGCCAESPGLAPHLAEGTPTVPSFPSPQPALLGVGPIGVPLTSPRCHPGRAAPTETAIPSRLPPPVPR